MRKTLSLILLAIAAAVVSAGIYDPKKDLPTEMPERPDTPADEEAPYFLLMGEAEAAIAADDLPTAILRLKDALQVDPTNPSNVLIYSNLGMIYEWLDRDSLALDALDRALEAAPAMTATRCNRGRLHLKMMNDSAAYADFSRVIERDSLNTVARYYRGLMALYGGDMRTATADLSVLATVAPDETNTLAALATLYSLTGENRRAAEYYRRLIAVDPSAEYYAALAGCYLVLGELTDASATIADGLALYPDDPELYYYRAWLNRDRYQPDQAHADARRAIALGANPARVAALFR